MSSSSSALIRKGVYFGNTKNQKSIPQKIGTRKFSDPVGTFDQQTGQYKESPAYSPWQDKRQEILIGDLDASMTAEWHGCTIRVLTSNPMFDPRQLTLAKLIAEGSTLELAEALKERGYIQSWELIKAVKLIEDTIRKGEFLGGGSTPQEKGIAKLKPTLQLLLQAGENTWPESIWARSTLNVSSVTSRTDYFPLIDLFLYYGIHFLEREEIPRDWREIYFEMARQGREDLPMPTIRRVPKALTDALFATRAKINYDIQQALERGQERPTATPPLYPSLELLVVKTLKSEIDDQEKRKIMISLSNLFSTFRERGEFESYLKTKGQTLQGASPSNCADFVQRRMQKREALTRLRLCGAFPRKSSQFIPESQKDLFDPSRLSRVSLDLKDLPKRT